MAIQSVLMPLLGRTFSSTAPVKPITTPLTNRISTIAEPLAEYASNVPWRLVVVVVLTVVAIRTLLRWITASTAVMRFSHENGCEPPQHWYPTKDWLLGTDFIRAQVKATREGRFLEVQSKRFEELGAATFCVKPLGRQGFLTIDPENIKAMLSVKFKDFWFGNRLAIMGPLMGRGIFTTDGEEWSHSRATLRPSFIKEQVADLSLLEIHMRHLLPLIPGNKTTIDLQDLFFRFTMDSATDFLFGHSVNTLCDSTEADQNFGASFSTALAECSLLFRMGPLRNFRRNPAAARAQKLCRSYVDQFVDQAVEYKNSGHKKPLPTRADGKVKKYFLQELADVTNDKEKMRDELLNILVAGRDTTASLLGSLFYMLARHPAIWQKVRSEVTEQLAGELPSYETLRGLQYCRFCVQETLRLFPPVPTNARVALRDTTLPRGGGIDGNAALYVPKGSIVVYTIFAMHRRKDLFGADAEEFKPERWESKRHSWEYLPFNGGPRICLGQQYALTEATYVLVRMAQTFSTIEPRDEKPWTEHLTLTISSKHGVKVALTAA